MKCWRKYVLCLTCVCCLGMLTGCGNANTTETEKIVDDRQNNTTDTLDKNKNDTNTNRIQDNTDGNTLDNGIGTERNTGNTAGDSSVNDVTNGDKNMNSGTLGEAGTDIMDGVGEAGKDIMDGVENAADNLTGNDTAQSETNNP